MFYDFIEAGLYQFESLSKRGDLQKGIVIEPITDIINKTEVGKYVFKENSAIDGESRIDHRFYVDDELRIKYDLPSWICSLSSFTQVHPLVEKEFNQRGIFLSEIKLRQVDVVTWEIIFQKYNVVGVNVLKLNSFKRDCKILELFLDQAEKTAIVLPEKIIYHTLYEKDINYVESSYKRLKELGYKIEIIGIETIATKNEN